MRARESTIAESRISPVTGFWTIFRKETARYLKIAVQTIMAPFLSQILFLAVFSGAYGSRSVEGVSFLRFLAPGAVFSGAALTAFQNPVFSIISMKYQGTLRDFCLYPISPLTRFLAFAASGAARGVLVGAMVYAASGFFSGFEIANPLTFWAFIILVSFIAAGIGTAFGFGADTYERGNFVTSLVLTPAIFLSGIYFDYRAAGDLLGTVARLNPLTPLVALGRGAYLGWPVGVSALEALVAIVPLGALALWTATTIAKEKGLMAE